MIEELPAHLGHVSRRSHLAIRQVRQHVAASRVTSLASTGELSWRSCTMCDCIGITRPKGELIWLQKMLDRHRTR